MSLFKEKLELKAEEAEFKAQTLLSRFQPWQKFVIIACLAGAIPGYFLVKAIGNHYFAKEYAQYLIQARPSFTDPKPLIIERSDIASLGEKEFAAAVQVENKNLDLAAKNISYTMKFLASDGSEAAPALRSQFYILPNQRKYLIAPKITS